MLASSSLRTAWDPGMLEGVGGRVCPWATWVEAGDLGMPQPPQQCRAKPDTRAMAPCLTPASAMEADLAVMVAVVWAALVVGPFVFCCCFCCLFALRLHRRVPCLLGVVSCVVSV
jgi:hypothetical protein